MYADREITNEEIVQPPLTFAALNKRLPERNGLGVFFGLATGHQTRRGFSNASVAERTRRTLPDETS